MYQKSLWASASSIDLYQMFRANGLKEILQEAPNFEVQIKMLGLVYSFVYKDMFENLCRTHACKPRLHARAFVH